MTKRNLIVAVNESDYIERLAEYIRHTSFGGSWQLTAFTNAAALRSFIRSGYPVDMLVAQPAMLDELGDLPGHPPTAAIVEHYGQSREERELLQYQPLPQLLQAMTSLYAAGGKQLMKPAVHGKGPAVVAVYSASGGTGKTTLSMHLAKHAGIAGLHSFYLNLEQWNVSLLADGMPGDEDFARLLYAMQSGADNGAAAVLANRKRYPSYSLDALAPSNNPDERLSLGADLAKKLIGAITAAGEYGLVIVDLDTRMDDMHVGAFEACDAVLWLTTPNAASRRKNELAAGYAERKFGAAFTGQQRKFRFVQIGGTMNESAFADGGGRSDGSPGFGGGGEIDERAVRPDAVLPFVAEWACGDSTSGTGAMAPHYRGAVDALMRKLGIL